MFKRLASLFSRPEPEAAASMPPVAPPKVKPGQRAWPSYFKSTKPDPKSPLTRTDRQLYNTDFLNYRNGTDTRTVLRDFVASSPDLSAAMWAYLRVGIPEKYTAYAVNAVDGKVDPAATQLLQQILMRMDTLTPYDEGYSSIASLKSVSESLARELLLFGRANVEIVLDKSRQPLKLQPISESTITYYPDGRGVKPVQKVGSETIDLDLATFFSVGLDADLLDPYSASPFESASKAVLWKESFANDVARIVRRVVHPRQKVEIDEEAFRKFGLSPEAAMDPDKARAELAALISDVESKINSLNPEDALVYMDSLKFEVENPGNSGLAVEYETLSQINDARLCAGSKVPGTVLGMQSGSSNIASSEIMLFMQSADSAIRQKLNSLYSRVFTLAVRLYGMDSVVVFEYDTIDLRPKAEMAAFRQTQQMMILEQLSLGFITDEEASLKLTGKLPPAGYKPLSGTMFHKQGATAAASPQEPSNSGSTLNQNLNNVPPDTGRGQNKKKSAEDESPEIEAQAQPTFVTPNITLNVDNTQQTQATVLKMKRDADGNLIFEKTNAAP